MSKADYNAALERLYELTEHNPNLDQEADEIMEAIADYEEINSNPLFRSASVGKYNKKAEGILLLFSKKYPDIINESINNYESSHSVYEHWNRGKFAGFFFEVRYNKKAFKIKVDQNGNIFDSNFNTGLIMYLLKSHLIDNKL